MPSTQPRLSSVLSPLIFGTATFNYQYNTDPHKLPTTALVHKALSLGVRAFDTSPYYGPSEEILGKALITPYEDTNQPFPRQDYLIVTKVGRIAGCEFNYNASWISKSVKRSLERLNTTYLDVVYCHDVEFVTAAEVITAVKELRRIRDYEGTVKYVGISGYPVSVLCDLAEYVLKETSEPLDCVMSYGNYTLQNKRLKSEGIRRFKASGVDVVPNASILGMGLLRSEGVPEGSLGNWHPAPEDLRSACRAVSAYCDSINEKLEVVAIRWALETWLVEGESVGSNGSLAPGLQSDGGNVHQIDGKKFGVSVIGVSSLQELEDTMRVWNYIVDGLEADRETNFRKGRSEEGQEWSIRRREEIKTIAKNIWDKFGKWQNFAWLSPGEDYVRKQVAA